jgi:hypothetical protein
VGLIENCVEFLLQLEGVRDQLKKPVVLQTELS